MGVARGGPGLIVATSMAAVEAVKDQLGVCRWNYVLRSMQQRVKSRVQSYYHSMGSSSSSSSSSGGSSAATGMVGNKVVRDLERFKKAEKSMNKVMDLSCWGPTTTRF